MDGHPESHGHRGRALFSKAASQNPQPLQRVPWHTVTTFMEAFTEYRPMGQASISHLRVVD